MTREFQQVDWDAALAEECRRIVLQAMREDLQDAGDLTSLAVVPADRPGRAAVVAREPIVLCGLPAAELTLAAYGVALVCDSKMRDGDHVPAGGVVAEISGPAQTLLSAERVVLNLLGRLSGIATNTRRYVDAVAGTGVGIYDTRKTTPGWRRLEKYAVRCGGGRNHRTGLFDAVLIKDNHLALLAAQRSAAKSSAADALVAARAFLASHAAARDTIVEIEVDTLEQLQSVLPHSPDIVLLDNMSPEQLRQAVALRDSVSRSVELEASGGITIDNVAIVATTGIERISIGALTHAARWVDLGLDWRD